MKRQLKNFLIFFLIGIIWTLLNVLLMWIFIDLLGIPTIIGSTIVVLFVFVTRYYAYVLIGLIHPRFARYTTTNIAFSLANIILVWLFIDILHIPTVVSSAVVIYGLFILKFFAFDKIGLLK